MIPNVIINIHFFITVNLNVNFIPSRILYHILISFHFR